MVQVKKPTHNSAKGGFFGGWWWWEDEVLHHEPSTNKPRPRRRGGSCALGAANNDTTTTGWVDAASIDSLMGPSAYVESRKVPRQSESSNGLLDAGRRYFRNKVKTD
jgi:hypothetical protein